MSDSAPNQTNDIQVPPSTIDTATPSQNTLAPQNDDKAAAQPASPRSIRSKTSRTNIPRIITSISPKERFRNSVKKVIQMQRSTTIMVNNGIGAEPGIDPRRGSASLHYGHIQQNCVIEVVDYSSVRSSFGRMTNREFVKLMQDSAASERESWVKVRWINIGGISWDVISALALKYNLHPLAVEDVLHHRDHNRSKADYYTRHLFLRVSCHQLGDPDQVLMHEGIASYDTDLVDSPQSENAHLDWNSKQGTLAGRAPEKYELSIGVSRSSTTNFRSRSTRRTDIEHNVPQSGFITKLVESEEQRRSRVRQIAIEQLKKDERVLVNVKPMCLFLLRDGTVISIHPTPDLAFTHPITTRLRQRDTLLRASADASLLIESILDLIVDQSMEVVDTYHSKIHEYESQVLLKMKLNTVRKLHILSGDLLMLKRTLEPVKAVISVLRQYDMERCAALLDQTDSSQPDIRVVGYMSRKSQIYLADVYDHADYIIQSLDMFTSIAENLIGYTFNMASYEMNVVMRRLTLATIIFLPLTIITGYFMNFATMPSVQNHSESLFWIIAIPILAAVIPLFLFSDIQSAFHYVQKRIVVRNAVKQYQRP